MAAFIEFVYKEMKLYHILFFFFHYLSSPSCSKHRELNELVGDQNFKCSSKYNILFIGIFAEKI